MQHSLHNGVTWKRNTGILFELKQYNKVKTLFVHFIPLELVESWQ